MFQAPFFDQQLYTYSSNSETTLMYDITKNENSVISFFLLEYGYTILLSTVPILLL